MDQKPRSEQGKNAFPGGCLLMFILPIVFAFLLGRNFREEKIENWERRYPDGIFVRLLLPSHRTVSDISSASVRVFISWPGKSGSLLTLDGETAGSTLTWVIRPGRVGLPVFTVWAIVQFHPELPPAEPGNLVGTSRVYPPIFRGSKEGWQSPGMQLGTDLSHISSGKRT